MIKSINNDRIPATRGDQETPAGRGGKSSATNKETLEPTNRNSTDSVAVSQSGRLLSETSASNRPRINDNLTAASLASGIREQFENKATEASSLYSGANHSGLAALLSTAP